MERSPALDLAGTILGGPGDERDELGSPAGLARWLDAEAPVLGEAPPEAPLRLREFRVLREAIRRLFAAVLGESEVAGRHYNQIHRDWIALARREI